MPRKLLLLLQTVVVVAAIFCFGEISLYGFASAPDKSALRRMEGVYTGPCCDALIEVAVPERGEIYHRLFSLYPRIADRGHLKRGEQLRLLVDNRGVILQIESAESGIQRSYEQEQRRHRRAVNLSTLVGALALLGCGLLYLAGKRGAKGSEA
ncbi:MAG TPA: hypothetical protein VIO59_06440 [Rhodanobacter sp.]